MGFFENQPLHQQRFSAKPNYKMLRFTCIALIFCVGAFGATMESTGPRGPRQYQQAQPQQQQTFNADPRQGGFGGNAELQLGPFGSVQGGANIGLPTSGSTLLTNAVIGLGAVSLINTIATVVTPYLTKNDATEDATTEKPAESRAMKALEDTVVESLLAAKKKYL